MPPKARYAPAWATWLLVAAGIVCVGIAVVYFARPASQLPSFFPGHDPALSRHHTTHGIGMIVVGLVCWAAAWLSTGSPDRPDETKS